MHSFSDYLLLLFSTVMLGLVTWFVFTAVKDKKQKHHAILRTYPIIGRIRYAMEKLGRFLRPWILENDNESRPFSRQMRSQVYRMAKGVKNVLSFGSTANPKTEIFVNSMFPLDSHEMDKTRGLAIGKDCEMPFIQRKVFNISGMSYGALSGNAIRALSIGAANAGITFNTGEGGKPSKYHRTNEMMDENTPGGLVLQIGTANFGYRDENGRLDYNELSKLKTDSKIRYIQIKNSQGAKPGKGGILLASKVTQEIAELRGVPEGKDCYSPSRNPDFGTPVDLLEGIKKVKQATGKPVGIKLAMAKVDELRSVLQKGIHLDLASGDRESHLPSVITIDGGDGGTGAAPALFMESLALPVRDILKEVNDMLVELGIRDKVALVASGKLVTAHEAAIAFAMGADWVESARGFMMSIGCINALDCAKGTCKVGIATQDKRLERALVPDVKAKNVFNYANTMESELFELCAACGVTHPRDLTLNNLVVPHKFESESVIARFKDVA